MREKVCLYLRIVGPARLGSVQNAPGKFHMDLVGEAGLARGFPAMLPGQPPPGLHPI